MLGFWKCTPTLGPLHQCCGQTGSRALCCRRFTRQATSPAPGVISEGALWGLVCCLLVCHVIGNHIRVVAVTHSCPDRQNTSDGSENRFLSQTYSASPCEQRRAVYLFLSVFQLRGALGSTHLLLEPMDWSRHLSPDRAGNNS